jgi:ankyrin repeat protein
MGSVDLTRCFIEHGADAAARDNDGSTLLHLAVQDGGIDLVNFTRRARRGHNSLGQERVDSVSFGGTEGKLGYSALPN